MAKKLIYNGTHEWERVNKETGEILERAEILEFRREVISADDIPFSKRSNFAVLYPLKFYGLINAVGSKKMEVIGYIIKHMGADNVLIATEKEIAQKSGVGKRTVERTLQALASANLIHRRPGVIMLNPQLLNRKHKAGEYRLMLKFDELDQKGQDNEQLRDKLPDTPPQEPQG